MNSDRFKVIRIVDSFGLTPKALAIALEVNRALSHGDFLERIVEIAKAKLDAGVQTSFDAELARALSLGLAALLKEHEGG